jgi:tetratricopeptide (TPR) repeat protein
METFMLSPAHQRLLVTELMKGIEAIGPEYEAFGTRLVNYIVNQKMQHRGLNPEGHPVGHAVDSVSETGEIAAEYSAEAGYFDHPFSKIHKDLEHCRKSHPQAKRVLLLSSQECGPKSHTSLVNLRAELKGKSGLDVEIYDSRRQAEYIVDQLLLNDSAIDVLSPYLASLEKVRSEYAATNLVPQLAVGYLRRTEVETELVRRLRTERVAALAGISGTGKSEMAVAVTSQLAGDFDMVIWVPATAIRAVNDLQAIDVDRRGFRVNLFHLLRERSCLVILDDLRIGLTAAELKQHCGDKSAILITRQSAFEGDIRIPFLARADARTLLERSLTSQCPDDVFEIVWITVGGHPLALRLMNAGVRNGSWDELPGDCAAIGQYSDEDRMQKLADRLLGRLEQVLKKELAFVVWCESARVDRSFARRALSSVGLRKIDEACLLTVDRNDVIRLHDIVFASIQGLHIPVAKYAADFDGLLDAHVEHLAYDSGTGLSFLSFCQVHGARLEKLLRAQPSRSTCLYCMAHTWSDQEVDLQVVGDPFTRANEIKASAAPKDIEVSAVCEAIEAIYRKVKYESGLDHARSELERYLDVFSILAESPRVSDYARRTARHHQAKALRNVQRYDQAITLCEEIIAKYQSPATKLLLARLLLFKDDKRDIEQAKNLLFELLEEADASPATAEISVTLAAIETLGRWQLKQWFREALQKFGSLVANYIVESANRGLDQAFVTFASIGRDLAYNDPALFVSVFRELPRRTPEYARDDRERAAWGHVLLAASEVAALGQPDDLAIDAVRFYEALQKPDPFSQQQHGRTLVLLNRSEDAVKVLQPLVANTPNPWNRYWLSKGLFKLGNRDEALRLIDEALADPKAKAYEAPFFEHRWEIRKASGDPAAVEDLQKAHDSCKDSKHRDSLAAKLVAENVKGGM